MPLSKDYLKSLISHLNFKAVNNAPQKFVKTYNNNYTITVDFENEKITYPLPLILGDNTTCNFEFSENAVVLECVNRLLEKGYEPQHIELERRWSLGHLQKSGKADITVYDRAGNSLLVIECKTFGDEYTKAKRKLEADGGQLFSYLQQDRNTRFLCLYASHLKGAEIVYQNLIIQIEDRPEVLKLLAANRDELAYETAKTKDDLHKVWKEQYNLFSTPNGIFDADVLAYEPQKIPIKRKDLKPFGEDEGRKFFNQFEEILRHNNISDKSNAFNRILSLILCKIVDEQKEADKVTDFQIGDTKESAEAIQDRLQRLYSDGMRKFLKEEIVYISIEKIEEYLRDFPEQVARDNIRKLFLQQKFYSSNEFAFKEIHNEKLFNENAKVLIEILKLLQDKQFRYARKDSVEYKRQKRYLGEFFELLLDAGYKQTAGQFFTPLPIAKFIVSALPIRERIKQKIREKQDDFLPYVIDYACGAGHFLIESFDEIQSFVDELKPDYTSEINENLHLWKNKDWTERFIYGVEKDYRLARTAKLACFMNGDGESNIIFGDGLEDYRNSEYKFPNSFDFLVANPPYSIKDFKLHTQASIKRNDFELIEQLSPSASEIEVLFVERTAQLLHTEGVAGVILPSSILSNTGIYTKAREILMRDFEIRAIVELGSNTFMATGTNTVTVFLKRRDEKAAVNAKYVANDFILHNKPRKNDFADTEKILADYANTIGFTLEDYKTFLSKKPNETVVSSEWYKDYHRWFDGLAQIKTLRNSANFNTKFPEEQREELSRRFYEQVLIKERDKFEIFFLAYRQKTLIVRCASTPNAEKKFLGYEFSKAKGKEGIKLYVSNGKHQTALYDEADLDNPEKLNHLVRQMILPALYDYKAENILPAPAIPAVLEEQAKIVDLIDCFDFSRVDFEKIINLSPKKVIVSKYALERLGEVCEIKIGGTPDRNQREYYENGEHLWVSISEMSGQTIYDTKEKINDLGVRKSNVKLIKAGTTLVSFKLSIGKTAVAGTDLYTNEAIAALEVKEKYKSDLLDKYIFLLFNSRFINLEADGSKAFGKSLNKDFLSEYVRIPLPPRVVQEQIISEIKEIETEEKDYRKIIDDSRKAIQQKADWLYSVYPLQKLGNTSFPPEYGAAEPAILGNPEKDYRYIRITDVDDNGKLLNKEFMTTETINDKYILENGDFLFARSGNTVGKTFLYSEEHGKAIYAGYFIRFKVNQDVLLPKFLDIVTKSTNYKTWVSQTQNGASQPNINAAKYSNYQIPLPKISEQEKVISEIENYEKQIALAEEKLKNIKSRKAEVLRKYL